MQYRDGQIYMAQASTLVEGQGVDFLAFCKPGDRLFIRDESVSYVVESIPANDRIVLTAPYRKTSKLTAYSIQLDYSAHFKLMMPYLGDFNVEDMLRLNIGKLDAMMQAACGGAITNPYTLEILSVLTLADAASGQAYRVKISTSHSQPARIKITLNGVVRVDNAPVTAADGVYSGFFASLTAGDYTLEAEVSDEKGNLKSKSAVFTVGAGGGVIVTLQPNSGAWTFTPQASAQKIGGQVSSAQNNVIASLELIHDGVTRQPWSENHHALAVPTGVVEALETIDFPGYPIKLKVWNLARQEIWRWDSAGAAAILESGGSLNIGGGAFTVTADPAGPTAVGQQFKTGWTATATESGVIVDAEIYYWGSWATWYQPKINLDQNTPSLSTAYHDGQMTADSFPVKYRLKNATKTVTITYADSTSAATFNVQDHAGTSSAPEAIISIDSITQIATTQNVSLTFQVLSNHATLITEWRAEVDGVPATGWVVAAANQTSTVTHTLTNLAVGSRNIVVRGRGVSVTDNQQTIALNVVDNSTTIAAPVLSNFVVTPGQGAATFALDVSDTRAVTYRIFRDGVEVFNEQTASVLTAINKTINVTAGAASFYISVNNAANKQASTAHETHTITPPDAGAATITPLISAITTATDGAKTVTLTADVDVPDNSYGIHYRFYRYLTGATPPADDPSVRGGFGWVQQLADNAPVTVTTGYVHETADYTYALDAKPQGGTTFVTASVDVAGQAGAGTGSISVQIDATSTVDNVSYTVAATISNTVGEAQEYRILEDGTEKVAWTVLANNAQLSHTINAVAGTYALVIEAKSASVAVITEALSITVNPIASSGTVAPGSNATQGNLKVTLDAIDWTVDPVLITYTPEIVNVSPAGLSIWTAYQPQWATDYGVFYEKSAGVLSTETTVGLTSGEIVKMKFELRDAASTVLASLETTDLTKP